MRGKALVCGKIACPGVTSGNVKIIRNTEDIDEVEHGNIMVAERTWPELVSAMRKAAAIVTDVGGVTSHAAVVAREFNIPCIVGCGDATKALKDGMVVVVDADVGVVYEYVFIPYDELVEPTTKVEGYVHNYRRGGD